MGDDDKSLNLVQPHTYEMWQKMITEVLGRPPQECLPPEECFKPVKVDRLVFRTSFPIRPLRFIPRHTRAQRWLGNRLRWSILDPIDVWIYNHLIPARYKDWSND